MNRVDFSRASCTCDQVFSRRKDFYLHIKACGKIVGHFICPYCPRLFKVRESLVGDHVPREHPSRVTEMKDFNLVIQFLPAGFSQADHSHIPASSVYDQGLEIEPTSEAVEPVRKQPGKVKAVSPESAEQSRRRGPKRLRLASSSSSSSSAESVSPKRQQRA